MATVVWALTCDFAYFDPAGRLCVIGADTNGIRSVAAGTHRLTIAAQLEAACDERLDPVLALRTPNSGWSYIGDVEFMREQRERCLLLHLPRVALTELGTYRFELALGIAQPTMLELSVEVREYRRPRVHLHGAY
jgi:hypothetical protein